jgi:glycopeptide antibiotics resistance protein
MPGNHHEITALPVVVPLAVVAFAAMLWRLHRRAALTLPRVLLSAAACVYGAGVVANTLLPISLGRPDDHQPWSVFLNLVPLVNTEPADMLQNVVVFVPLGLLLPLLARVGSARRILLHGFLLSLTMEVVQLANSVTGHGGHIADINDLLANTLGAAVGHGLFRAALLLPALARTAAAASWPTPADAETEAPRTRVDVRRTGADPTHRPAPRTPAAVPAEDPP